MSDFMERLTREIPEFAPYYESFSDVIVGDVLGASLLGSWLEDEEVPNRGPDTEVVRRAFALVETILVEGEDVDPIITGFIFRLMDSPWAVERMCPATRRQRDLYVRDWDRLAAKRQAAREAERRSRERE